MQPRIFLKANLSGRDRLKASKPLLPESLGLVSAVVYLITIYLFLPFPFAYNWTKNYSDSEPAALKTGSTNPHIEFSQFLSGLLSIQAMTLLGFADDVFDIKWRHKVLMPAVAAVPLLIVYYISAGVTYVVVPFPLNRFISGLLDLGFLYYVYMGMVAIFCTNAINILAGANGVEIGQSVVLASTLIIFNLVHLQDEFPGIVAKHLLSLYLLVPFLAVSLPLLRCNWYPAKAFVGDTYCYFAGMVFAVVGILGHFSKTLLLFFAPQIFNFVFSAPQIFHILPCPRHRMPVYEYTYFFSNRDSSLNTDTGLLEASRANLQEVKLNPLQLRLISVTEFLGFIAVERGNTSPHGLLSMTNFTLLSFILVKRGPMREDRLALWIMFLQSLWSLLAFLIRYKLIYLFYNAYV
ncbi:tunicamycin resistance protein, variant 3 [Entomophthora muscae]|uniref:Tunicamycin resistance protein, variant 3 n=1 Tax=Entomophthora muscae TaxID=34485 RepID=A0ACC2SSG6_9FUNG|nr:tunicamycin resistance protein, variant 3 [Entomophthora muscae]